MRTNANASELLTVIAALLERFREGEGRSPLLERLLHELRSCKTSVGRSRHIAMSEVVIMFQLSEPAGSQPRSG